jgi:hypothetical protein
VRAAEETGTPPDREDDEPQGKGLVAAGLDEQDSGESDVLEEGKHFILRPIDEDVRAKIGEDLKSIVESGGFVDVAEGFGD